MRRGWVKQRDRWVWQGPAGQDRRGGPWRTIEGEGQTEKPAGPPRAVGKSVRDLPLLEWLDLDIRDRGVTPPSWYEPFREATWDEALELVTQELLRIKREGDGVFIAGANTTESHPGSGAAIKRAHERGAMLIVADPRKTELAARADIHLQMQPGTDVALFNAMLSHILAQGLEAKQFIADRTREFGKLRESVRAMTPEVAAKITGVPAEKIKRAAEIYARGPNTSTLWAMGLTQHANGTDLVTSLLNLMLACGMIGRWGAAMMPVRGQNNVQGASDVGAIPFVYTDYRSVKDPKVRAEYAKAWDVPAESLSLKEGLMVTEIVKEESGVRGMY